MSTLKKLPYDFSALEPYVSARTLEFHYTKHHQTYLDNLNKLIKDTDLENKSLEEIIKITFKEPSLLTTFNNAAQTWNHDFYWQSLKPNSSEPKEDVKQILIDSFISYEKFKEEFKSTALSQFGSGWIWLVLENGKVKIIKTSNADNPLTKELIPLLVVDVWEHAYYLDYQNRRADYVEALINNLLNWEFFKENLNNFNNK
ncbi:MAG: superoxide dismutase [Minisyncoccia bacterium]